MIILPRQARDKHREKLKNSAVLLQRAPPLLEQLRAGLGPDVPILILEGHTYLLRGIYIRNG